MSVRTRRSANCSSLPMRRYDALMRHSFDANSVTNNDPNRGISPAPPALYFVQAGQICQDTFTYRVEISSRGALTRFVHTAHSTRELPWGVA